MHKILFLALLATLSFTEEPSAFNAGGDSPLKNETQLLNEKLFNLSTKIDAIEQSQEGLKSVFDGFLQKIQSNSNRLNKLYADNDKNIQSISDIRKNIDSNFALQNENIQNLKNSILALGELLEKNNARITEEFQDFKKQILENNKAIASLKKDYELLIKKNEENNALKQSVQNQQTVNQSPTKIANKTENEKLEEQLEKKELPIVFQEAEKLFENKQYLLASKYLNFSIKKYYRPAKSNYLLGEIAFFQKRYEDAISHYKTSASLYNKADYLPRLMLNTANSFMALKDVENTKKFLETLVKIYPQSPEAKEAEKKLSNL